MINNEILNTDKMKKILFILPLAALLFASCEKDNGELSGDDIIQFKDPNFLEALLSAHHLDNETQNIDTNGDGKISVNEAQNVTYLSLYDYTNDKSFNITDLSEIKYFTSLEYLYCECNQLTTLDLSQNTSLIEVECWGNRLTSLTVNNCSSLRLLVCEENQLSTIDLSTNESLSHFECGWNNFEVLDLSKNIELRILDCVDNPLEKIVLNRNHNVEDSSIQEIMKEYGDILEYVE